MQDRVDRLVMRRKLLTPAPEESEPFIEITNYYAQIARTYPQYELDLFTSNTTGRINMMIVGILVYYLGHIQSIYHIYATL